MLTDRERDLREILNMMWGVNGNSIQERIPECPVRMIREEIELVSITLSRSVLRGSEASPRSTSVRGVTSCVGTVGLELRWRRGIYIKLSSEYFRSAPPAGAG